MDKPLFRLALALVSVLATAGSFAAPAQADPVASAQLTPQNLLQAEDALFAADVHRDVAAIDRGFADEAVFVHAGGMTQTKADYIKATSEDRFQIKEITTEERTARIFGKIGVVRGVKRLIANGGMHLAGTYLTVYVFRDGRWQMLDEQSSPMPAPAKP